MSSDGNASGPSLPLHSSPHAVSADETLETRSEEHGCRPGTISLFTYETGLSYTVQTKRAHPVLGTALMVKHILMAMPEHFFLCSEGLVELWMLIGFRGRVLHLLNQ